MVTKGPGEVLLGRQTEIEALDRLLAAVRDGRGGGLVLRGEPGVGKTALLKHAIASASGFRVARALGASRRWSSRLRRFNSWRRRAR